MTQPPTGLPTNIGAPANRALVAAGYTELRQLAGVPAAELKKLHGMGPRALRLQLKKLHGMGPRALRLLQEALEAQGQSLG